MWKKEYIKKIRSLSFQKAERTWLRFSVTHRLTWCMSSRYLWADKGRSVDGLTGAWCYLELILISPFALRHAATKGILVAMVCTFFEAFNVPVFWPILVMYFIMLFCITMKRQIKVKMAALLCQAMAPARGLSVPGEAAWVLVLGMASCVSWLTCARLLASVRAGGPFLNSCWKLSQKTLGGARLGLDLWCLSGSLRVLWSCLSSAHPWIGGVAALFCALPSSFQGLMRCFPNQTGL